MAGIDPAHHTTQVLLMHDQILLPHLAKAMASQHADQAIPHTMHEQDSVMLGYYVRREVLEAKTDAEATIELGKDRHSHHGVGWVDRLGRTG